MEPNRFTIIWYTEYLGVGYAFSPEDIRIFPVFPAASKEDAEDIWTEHVEPFPDQEYVVSFVEDGDDYHFIMYRKNPLRERVNWFFYRSSLSQEGHYRTLKSREPEEVNFTFGYIDNGRIEMSDVKKLVTQLNFMNVDEIEVGSMEDVALQTQREIRGL